MLGLVGFELPNSPGQISRSECLLPKLFNGNWASLRASVLIVKSNGDLKTPKSSSGLPPIRTAESSGNRSRLRLTAWLKTLVETWYNVARSASNITLWAAN